MNKLKRMLDYILKKSREPSSWAGIGIVGPTLAPHIPSGWWQTVMYAGPALAGLLLIVMDENEKAP